MKHAIAAAAICHILWVMAISAQTEYKEPVPNRELKINVDQYIHAWQQSEPNVTHGVLIERAILKSGDPNHPGPPGQVLEYHRELALATLEAGSITTKMHHREQEILYVEKGQGQLRSGNRRWRLREGLAVLIPPGMEHQLLNEGEDSLTLLLLTEL